MVPFGRRAIVRGSLSDRDGRPVVGAAIDVLSRIRRPGSRFRLSGAVLTDASGEFAYRVPAGPSRIVRLAYRAFLQDVDYTVTTELRFGVRAGVSFRVAPRRVRNGGRVRFRGELQGGPGRRGTSVQIYAVGGRSRRDIPVETVRADRRGRFHYRYRFRSTFRPTRYAFLARVIRQGAYPYASGSSPAVAVRVHP